MLWMMMTTIQKMFTQSATKSTHSTKMPDTLNFTGDAVTVLGLVGVISTGIILVLCFTRYFNSPLRKWWPTT
jgi:phosphotransferase system  glucose/maltose/N-acetylglucosamine-specific IIC component